MTQTDTVAKPKRPNPRVMLKQAIKIVGGPTAVARALRLRSQNVVQGWLTYNGLCPAKWVVALERATKGAVTREMLRPDLFGRG